MAETLFTPAQRRRLRSRAHPDAPKAERSAFVKDEADRVTNEIYKRGQHTLPYRVDTVRLVRMIDARLRGSKMAVRQRTYREANSLVVWIEAL